MKDTVELYYCNECDKHYKNIGYAHAHAEKHTPWWSLANVERLNQYIEKHEYERVTDDENIYDNKIAIIAEVVHEGHDVPDELKYNIIYDETEQLDTIDIQKRLIELRNNKTYFGGDSNEGDSDDEEDPTIEDLKISVFTDEDFKQIQEYRFRRR